MTHPKAPAEIRAFIASHPSWLTVQTPITRLSLPNLDSGEAAAISLAAELGAALLIDEIDGRQEAQALGLTVIGAVGVLERAADAGFIADLAEAHNRVRSLNFYISDALLQASLARHLANAAAKKGSP
jgi:predicted nucleic acid-binding protein